jgi:uncharacterized protein YqeY
MLETKLDADIKTALLGGDKFRAEVLRGLKSVLLNEKIAKGQRAEGLSDDVVLGLIGKEVKKRIESAELYKKGDAQERADKELKEKEILEEYLPKQLSDEELAQVVADAVAQLGEGAQMGQIIGAVRQKVGATAGGGRIAAAVKAKLGS